jgi:hypothetical protein
MTRQELKRLQESRRTAFPKRDEVVVVRTPLQQQLDRIPAQEGWDTPIEQKQEVWRSNLRREIAEGL